MPAFIISCIRTSPVPNTMALGGVATGSMKAHEADRVAGIISKRGFTRIAVDNEPRIGNIISVVAVFDVSSVRKVSVALTDATKNTGENEPKPAICSPNQTDRPDSLKPLANAKPPPKRITIPQCSFEAVFQSINRRPLSRRLGMINSNMAIVIAMVPSSMNPGTGIIVVQPGMVNEPTFMLPRNSHSAASSVKRKSTTPSSKQIFPKRLYSSLKTAMSAANESLREMNKRVSVPQAIIRKTTANGNPNTNQLAKEISGAPGKYILNIRLNDRLGGVPIRVAVPPMEAA